MPMARIAEPSAHYERHRPQDSLLYKIVAEHYPTFLEHLHAQGTTLPRHVQIRQWVLSFPFPLRFLLATRPDILSKALAIVYRAIAAFLIKQTGFTRQTARTGAVAVIQRLGSALNLNPHLHMLLLDGVYAEDKCGKTRFYLILW